MSMIDLEIEVSHPVESPYLVDLRYTSESDIDRRLRTEVSTSFDVAKLIETEQDPVEYGKQLAASLFQDSNLRAAFAEAKALSVDRGDLLRVRVNIAPNAPDLHSLKWEALRDPESEFPLFTGERTVFSRYISSFSAESSSLKSKGDLSAMVVIANPSDLEETSYGTLHAIEPDQEINRARKYLGDIRIKHALVSNGTANLKTVMEKVRDGVDILYIVCHGKFAKKQTSLFFETPDGKTDKVTTRRLVSRFAEIRSCPKLVVLAACESAGKGGYVGSNAAPLSALGPALAAETGIGAVLAMQGPVKWKTLDILLPVFFKEIRVDGFVDRAMSIARGEVRDRGQRDWWVPVLYMRIKSGRLWYRRGYADCRHPEEDEDHWTTLVKQLKKRRCTPILGPGLVDRIFGSRREIARDLARQFRFPMSSHSCEELPQVSQYVAIKHKHVGLRESLEDYLRTTILDRFADQLSSDSRSDEITLSTLISRVGASIRERDDKEPHKLLAQLPIKVYVTTNFNNLLAEALTEEGKEPRIEWCRWNRKMEHVGRGRDGELYADSLRVREPDYYPDIEKPLVYHLFGHLDEDQSLVLTEDDYFDFLMGSTADKNLIPEVVKRSLTNAGLLFLGYQLDDWNFRVLFRSIMRLEGATRREDYENMAVQVDPEAYGILEPEGARQYLTKYFNRAGDINVYWGGSIEFVGELFRRWKEIENG